MCKLSTYWLKYETMQLITVYFTANYCMFYRWCYRYECHGQCTMLQLTEKTNKKQTFMFLTVNHQQWPAFTCIRWKQTAQIMIQQCINYDMCLLILTLIINKESEKKRLAHALKCMNCIIYKWTLYFGRLRLWTFVDSDRYGNCWTKEMNYCIWNVVILRIRVFQFLMDFQTA